MIVLVARPIVLVDPLTAISQLRQRVERDGRIARKRSDCTAERIGLFPCDPAVSFHQTRMGLARREFF
jgi:hypothetical protein